jgi:hypothetical protein
VSKPATLADILYRASFNKTRNRGWTDNAKWRDALRRAKKFVIDDEMSIFMGELSTAAFMREKMSPAARFKIIEHLRMGARLPGEVTWIEYNLRKAQARSHELLGKPFDPTQAPEREGWLLMRHHQVETAFVAHIVSHDADVDHGDGHNTWTFPVGLAWACDMDTVIPWRRIPFDDRGWQPSEVSTGLFGYKTERAGFVFTGMVNTPNQPDVVANLLREWSGVQRRMWALLATINDLPVLVQEVKASRGFMGGRNYRKFLDFKTITLTVPQKLYRKTIRDALSLAHRRGGPVRAHWRDDWRNPLSPLCGDHDWGADEKHMFCTRCKGRKIWVDQHTRGDTSRGFVSTDFKVTHDTTS